MNKVNQIIMVLGGARSGKSCCAEALAREAGMKRFYIATCPVLDEEMRDRVARHRAMRAADCWVTIEEEVALEKALEEAAGQGADSILVDCLTLWVNNLLYRTPEMTEKMMAERSATLLACLKKIPCRIVLVINEVGLGLVPESALARRFRDLSGRLAQILAAGADEVYFMIAGIKQRIK